MNSCLWITANINGDAVGLFYFDFIELLDNLGVPVKHWFEASFQQAFNLSNQWIDAAPTGNENIEQKYSTKLMNITSMPTHNSDIQRGIVDARIHHL